MAKKWYWKTPKGGGKAYKKYPRHHKKHNHHKKRK